MMVMLKWKNTLFAVAALMFGASSLSAHAASTDPVKPALPCAQLKEVDLSDIGGKGSGITSATETIHNGVAVCSVEGTLAPTIGIKVLLPTQTWTQRYLQVGCGGLCGRASLEVGAADGCMPVEKGGFVVGSTDMGHSGMSGDFGRDEQKRADFAYRAQHVTALASKKLIRAFYGQKESYAYFSGCSDGGREALVEAQRFPGDFNGIIAGAAAMNFQVQNSFYHAWQARANTGPDGKAILLASRLPLLHQAVLKQCDATDGQVDGLISEPRACHFDPAVLLCSPEAKDKSACMTSAEVDAVRRLYEGPKDPATGHRLTIAGPQYGSELAWAGVFVPDDARQPTMSEMVSLSAIRNLIFEQNPPANFRLADFAFDLATFEKLKARHPLFDATNPDLSAFAAGGGKLILWHGWADPHISPINTVAYHEAVEKVMGKAKATAFERLYLFPGMYHCSNGDGPSQIDLLTPMMKWVENGQAPDAIVVQREDPAKSLSDPRHSFGQPMVLTSGNKTGKDAPTMSTHPPMPKPGSPVQSHPVYPYPDVAVYGDQGDPNQASSFVRGKAPASYAIPDWAGAAFYTPYPARTR